MGLLDMPPEIFQHIVHDLVSAAGPGEAWKYRTLCRIFAAEIAHDVFAKSDKDDFKTTKDRRLLERGLDIFLLNRLDLPRDVDPAVLAKLTGMLDYLVQEVGLQGKDARSSCAEDLCHGLVTVVEPSRIIDAMSGRGPVYEAWQTSTLNVHDQLLAAIACEEYAVVKKVLPQSSATDIPTAASRLCTPLALAVGGRAFKDTDRIPVDQELLSLVLEFFTSLKLGTQAEQALFRDIVTGERPRHDISNAVLDVVKYGDRDMLTVLLNFYTHHQLRPTRSMFNKWFLAATCCHNEEMAQLLIDFAPKGKSLINYRNLLEACQGNATIIKATLSQLNLADIDAGKIYTIPLFVAVRSGNLAAVEIMLDAGADINISVAGNIPSLNKHFLSPLDVALYHKNNAIVQCLLENEADVPHISEWPTHRESYENLRKWEMEEFGSQIPTWAEARRLRKAGVLEDLEY